MKHILIFIMVISLLGITACSWFDKKEKENPIAALVGPSPAEEEAAAAACAADPSQCTEEEPEESEEPEEPEESEGSEEPEEPEETEAPIQTFSTPIEAARVLEFYLDGPPGWEKRVAEAKRLSGIQRWNLYFMNVQKNSNTQARFTLGLNADPQLGIDVEGMPPTQMAHIKSNLTRRFMVVEFNATALDRFRPHSTRPGWGYFNILPAISVDGIR